MVGQLIHSIKKIFNKFIPCKNMNTKEIFTSIKQKNLWGGVESVSGPGSTIDQTKILVAELSKLFTAKNIKSLLDIPCGDFNWMKTVDLSNINYIGADIVDDLIESNIKKYGSETIHFKNIDLINENLPECDIIFVRDCLVHFSYEDIFKAIKNIKISGCRYLLTTTFTSHSNTDIITGDWRPLNLQIAPFNLPNPILIINEGCSEDNGIYSDKSMGLWEISTLTVK
jgi:hypothetical protein